MNSKSKKILYSIIFISLLGLILSWIIYPILMIYIPIIGSLLFYLTVRYENYKPNDTPEEYFLYNREMPEDEFVPTYVVSNIGLFSSIAFSVILAFYSGIGGMIIMVSAWFLGMYFFSRSIPKLLPFFKQGNTLHEFIASKYSTNDIQNASIRSWTSLVSSILYFASVGVEIKFAADLFAPSLGGTQSTTLAFFIAAIGIGYSFLSGYKGVVYTDKIQYYIMIFMSVAIVIVSMFLIGGNSFSIPASYFSFPAVVFTPDPFGLFSLVVLMFLYQFCVMDMWQRCIAIVGTKNKNAQKYTDAEIITILQNKTFKRALLPFLFFFIIWFLIGIAVLGTNLTSDPYQILQSFIAYFDQLGNFGLLLKGIVFAGLVAAALSTVDTFLLATVQTLMYDIYGIKVVKGLTNNLSSIPLFQKYRFVNLSRFLVLFVGLFAVLFAFLDKFNIMSFWTSMYSIMLSFFAPVWYAIKDKNNLFSFNSVRYSIIVGSLGALILGIVGTFLIPNTFIVNSAPLFAFTVPFIFMNLIEKK